MGNSILLLLGLIICINIGINLVTLVRNGGYGWGRVAGRQAWLQGPTRGHHVLLYLALEQNPDSLTPNVPYHL